MWAASFVVFYPLIVSAYCHFRKKQIDKPSFLFILTITAPLFLLSSMRYAKYGSDTRVYFDVFQGIINNITSPYNEPGFNLLLKFISLFSHNSQVLLIVLNLIFFSLFFKFIISFSKCVWLSIFLFIGMEIFDQSMLLIRQLLALSIIVNSFYFIEKHEYLKFAFIVTLASSIHFTAIFFLLVPLLQFVKLNKVTILTYISLIMVLWIYSAEIMMFVMSKLHIYEKYMYSEDMSIVHTPKLACLLHLFINLSIVLFCYLFGHNEESSNYLMLKIIMIGSLFWALSTYFAVVGRMAIYFEVFSIILIPNIYKSLGDRKIKSICISSLLICFILKYYIIAYLRPEWFSVYPYKFFFMS